MRFKQIIQEEDSSRAVYASLERAAELITQNCSAALDHFNDAGRCIFRGVYTEKPKIAFIGDSTKAKPRKSANTTNYYTLMIDNSEVWKQYPKRGHSFICSTDMNYADNYGDVFLVFPANKTKIGICPSIDIWDSFSSINDNGIAILNDEISFLLKMCASIGNEQSYESMGTEWQDPDNSIQEFKRALNGCEQLLSDNNIQNKKQLFELSVKMGSYYRPWWNDYGVFLDKILIAGQKHNGIYKWYERLIDPSLHGFKLTTIEQFTFPPSREIWFSGSGVFVNSEYTDELKYLLANQKI